MCFKRVVCYLLILGFLCSCLSVQYDAPHNYSLTENPQKGLCFFSLSSNMQAGSSDSNILLVYKKRGDDEKHMIMYWRNGQKIEDPNWRLVVLEMDSGDYELVNLVVIVHGASIRKEIEKSFTVEEGKATYLENVMVEVASLNLGGGYISFEREETLEKRDLAAFLEKYPLVSEKEIKKSSFK